MNTVKNVYSPAGMEYWDGNFSHVNLIDCPGCKFGTLDFDHKENKWTCADCNRKYSAQRLSAIERHRGQYQ